MNRAPSERQRTKPDDTEDYFHYNRKDRIL